MSDPITQLKPYLWLAVSLVGIGIAWAEWTARLNAKADRSEVQSLSTRVEQEARDAAAESRINRILLCRMPEIRPDSHCEGFR